MTILKPWKPEIRLPGSLENLRWAGIRARRRTDSSRSPEVPFPLHILGSVRIRFGYGSVESNYLLLFCGFEEMSSTLLVIARLLAQEIS